MEDTSSTKSSIWQVIFSSRQNIALIVLIPLFLLNGMSVYVPPMIGLLKIKPNSQQYVVMPYPQYLPQNFPKLRDPIFNYPLNDQITRYGGRYDSLRQYLPKTDKSIGYINDSGKSADKDYFLTLYFLAPWKFDYDLSRSGDYVLLNCEKAPFNKDDPKYSNFELVKVFDSGFVLFKKRPESK